MQGKTGQGGKARVLAALLLALAASTVAACNRDKVELTQCEGGVPEIARTSDVAPPNC